MKKIKNLIKSKEKVYSLEYGVGEITGILKLYDAVEDYIEVQFSNNQDEIKHFPLDFTNDLRLISNPLELTYILKKLNAKIVQTDYLGPSKSYQRIGVDMDLDFLINVIANFVGRIDLLPNDKSLLSLCVDSLILEVGQVYNVNKKHAKGIVSDYMKAA